MYFDITKAQQGKHVQQVQITEGNLWKASFWYSWVCRFWEPIKLIKLWSGYEAQAVPWGCWAHPQTSSSPKQWTLQTRKFDDVGAYGHNQMAQNGKLCSFWLTIKGSLVFETQQSSLNQRKFRNLTSDYTESCCWRSVNQEMWSRRCDTAEMCRIWRVGSARNAVFYHSFVASPARKVRS